MQNTEMPDLELLKHGALYKVLQVSGQAGMMMPDHHCTQEAVVVVQQGTVVLRLEEKEYILRCDEPFIIPAGISHSLQLQDDFKAIVIMTLEAEIKF